MDVTKSPFNQLYGPPKKLDDDVVESRMTIVIRHFPTETILLQEAYRELEKLVMQDIADVFNKYGIDKPKSAVLEF